MAERACVKRLQKEYRALCKEPVPQVVARPLPSDVLEWHYVLEGSEGTPFAGGYYYGKIKFSPEYPFKPPSISMTTPNGRFAPNKKICLSMSDFHPESWNPMWSVSSILTGLLSFMDKYFVCNLKIKDMLQTLAGHGWEAWNGDKLWTGLPSNMMDDGQTTGSIKTSNDEKRKLARSSLAYNCQSKNCPNFKKLFPEYVEKYNQHLIAEKSALEQETQRKLSTAPLSAVERSTKVEGEDNKVANIAGQRRQTKQLPSWLLLLLVSVFGIVMTLPLLQP